MAVATNSGDNESFPPMHLGTVEPRRRWVDALFPYAKDVRRWNGRFNANSR